MRAITRLLWLTAAAWLACALPTAAQAPEVPAPAEPAEYRSVVASAIAEFDAGRFAEARALFLRAHDLWPSARTLRTLGMTAFELRLYPRALVELQAALDDPRRPLADAERAQVQELLAQTRAFVGRYRLRLSPPELELSVDGAPRPRDDDAELLLAVGAHELLARAPGHQELRRTLVVEGREDEELLLSLPLLTNLLPAETARGAVRAAPEPASSAARGGSRLFTWIAGGTAVALAGTSLALWLISDAKFDEQKTGCEAMPGKACERGTIETAGIKDTQTAHQVTAVLAGAVGAAAVALFFIEGDGEDAPQVAIEPAGLSARGRF
jgi:hypothetical protein